MERQRFKRDGGICPASGCWEPRGRTRYCERHAEWRRGLDRQRDREMRLQVIAMLGARCQCCGEDNIGFLSVEHPLGDGGAERKTHGTRQALKRILDGRVVAELLCFNCNLGRAFNGGPCPHQEGR